MMSFCEITRSYFQILFFIFWVVFSDTCTTELQTHLINLTMQSRLKEFFEKYFLRHYKTLLKNYLTLKTSDKLCESHARSPYTIMIASLLGLS